MRPIEPSLCVSLTFLTICATAWTTRAQDKLVPEDLARGKTATADATPGENPTEHAVDGRYDTRWCAIDDKPGHWWQVDLGQSQIVTGCRIVWEFDGRRYRFKIEGSADGRSWRVLSDQTKTEARKQDQTWKFDADDIRYVRITSTELPNGWMSFWAFEVHGTKMVPPPKEPTPLAASPEAALHDVKVPEGFTATLFAGPPDVSYPTCVAAGPTGEVFVGVDENGSLGKDQARRQRIVRCLDEDGDGVAEKINVFAEKVGSVRGMFYHDGKLWVLHPPLLRVFYDDDRDGVADRNETLVEGLGTPALAQRGADHCTNGFGVGIDGWIYIAVGDFGFTEAKAKDGSTAQLYGGGIARVRMDGSELEIYARNTRNIYDVAVSPEMQLFTRDNTNDGGGWNVRLSQIIQTGDYGYPRAFKNFADDIVQPLADYGGGSPTGALYIDEPTLPDEYARSLYTVDWGRNVVYRHPLAPHGAGFKAEQHPFVQLPRPTDMDIDAAGNIYIASWKDGGFKFERDDVGYVIRVRPTAEDEALRPSVEPIDDLRKASTDELLKQLSSDSHTLRLHAQLEILRRGEKNDIADRLRALVSGEAPLPARIAALYTLKQLAGEGANLSLVRWMSNDQLRPHAVRALADRKSQIDSVTNNPIAEATNSGDARGRLAIAIALGRLGRSEGVLQLAKLIVDEDPLVAHAAVNALVAIGDAGACFEVCDAAKRDEVAIALLQALRRMHSTETVDGLIDRLSDAKNAELRAAMLTALCRLAYREDEWKGNWWGTRPDTRGPYYRPASWSETDRILNVLKGEAASGDTATLAHLHIELPRHRIDTKGWKLTDGDGPSLADLLQKPEIAESDAPILLAAAKEVSQSPVIRAQALLALLRSEAKSARQAAFEAALALGDEREMPAELLVARMRYVFDPAHAESRAELAEQTNSDDPQRKQLAQAVLGALDNEPASGPDGEVKRIKALSYDEAVSAATREDGDPVAGARLFVRKQCFACHTTSPEAVPIGPYLGGIHKRYKPAELAESILRPSAKVAQGFATQQFITDQGKILTGFVVSEGADELEIRDAEGRMFTIEKDAIDERIPLANSIMPDGLADEMTPRDLASLMALLTMLREK